MKKKLRLGRLLFLAIVLLVVVYSCNNMYQDISDNESVQEDYVIAVVEGETIMNSDVEMLIASIPTELDEVVNKKLFLNQTIFNTLLDKEIINENITVNDETYQKYLQEYLNFLSINQSEFEEAFDNNNTVEDFKDLFLVQIKRDIFLRENVISNISVSEEEITMFYDENIELFQGYNLSSIKHLIESEIFGMKQRDIINNYFEELIQLANFEIYLFEDACSNQRTIYYYENSTDVDNDDVLLVRKTDYDLVSFCHGDVPTNSIVKKGIYEEIGDIENIDEVIEKYK
ncbi:hypothetical protein KY321_04295 [Candidatus Woesearchaeota archaeon]|nr:hypothetical protein [Candidatus Woesearchaeota archaeon]